MSLEQESRDGLHSADSQTEGVSIRMLRRRQEHESWEAYWKLTYINSAHSIVGRWRYYMVRAIDIPATFLRTNICEPLQDKYKRPYYHRRLDRVPEIDTCASNDLACVWEANEQFRYNKGVDQNIVEILRNQFSQCATIHKDTLGVGQCTKALEEFEEAELNMFIKYNELPRSSDSRDAYMKQKHRMIWERRHPELMAERQRLFDEHKAKYNEGQFDMSFWKTNLSSQHGAPDGMPYKDGTFSAPSGTALNAFSKDSEYYRREFEAGNTRPDNPPMSEHAPPLLGFFRIGLKKPEPFVKREKAVATEGEEKE